MLSRFHTIPERDKQTDRQTDRRTDRQTALLYQYRASALLCDKLEGRAVVRIYVRQRCSNGLQWIKPFKNHASLQRREPNTHRWNFPDVIKFRVAAHTMSEKAIWFRHPDYNPDRAQKLISLSMSRHLSTRNISTKSMHEFLSNLANRQTDRQTNTGETYTSSFVGGKKIGSLSTRGDYALSPPYPSSAPDELVTTRDWRENCVSDVSNFTRRFAVLASNLTQSTSQTA